MEINEHVMEVCGIIYHVGRNLNAGHYTCHVRVDDTGCTLTKQS